MISGIGDNNKIDINDIIDSIDQLPVLPGTSLRLINVLSDINSTIDQIVDAIRHDQNLTVQVLKLCNSAFFGFTRKITSLQQAVTYLGSKQLLQLVFNVHCKSTFNNSNEGYGLLAGMLWKHSNAVAIASEKISKYRKLKPAAGLFFTAGLLHDIGKVILDNILKEHYQQVLDLAVSERIRFDEAERKVLGFSHEDVGQMIAEKWQLPDAIGITAKYHHEPANYRGDDNEIREVLEIVHISDSLVMMLGIGIGYDGLLYSVNEELVEKYQIESEYMDCLGAEVMMELEKLEKIYSSGGERSEVCL